MQVRLGTKPFLQRCPARISPPPKAASRRRSTSSSVITTKTTPTDGAIDAATAARRQGISDAVRGASARITHTLIIADASIETDERLRYPIASGD